MPDGLRLHTYFRSSASWRVRIALHLKGLDYQSLPHHLRKGEQTSASYLALNPQGLVPALETDGEILTQSLAICEYLDEVVPNPPLLPAAPLGRAKVRAAALAIACEIHPLQNLRVLGRLRAAGLNEDAVNGWARDTIEDGLTAFAHLLDGQAGPYCFGEAITLADICLVPQLANARRFGARIDYPRIEAIEAACLSHPAFAETRPELQPDAE